MTKVLKLIDLNYSIEAKKIINRLNVSVKNHQILAVLGQSGSGKSTLLKLVAGLIEPDSGILEIDGERIPPPSEKLIPGHPKIKIVRQDNPLFPNISLKENIEYELRFFNEKYRNERVEKLLKMTGLKKVANQLPRHSSEGEQQRTAIARALADEPLLLLLDEPFSNLDYKNKSLLKEEVKQIVQEENMACIFVTHDITDVFGTSDELAILKKGKITQQGTPLEVYNNPKSIYEASITGDFNLVSQQDAHKILGIKTEARSIMIRPEGVILDPRGSFSGEVISLTDKGVYKEMLLKTESLTLKSFGMTNSELNGNVKFKIDLFSEM